MIDGGTIQHQPRLGKPSKKPFEKAQHLASFLTRPCRDSAYTFRNQGYLEGWRSSLLLASLKTLIPISLDCMLICSWEIVNDGGETVIDSEKKRPSKKREQRIVGIKENCGGLSILLASAPAPPTSSLRASASTPIPRLSLQHLRPSLLLCSYLRVCVCVSSCSWIGSPAYVCICSYSYIVRVGICFCFWIVSSCVWFFPKLSLPPLGVSPGSSSVVHITAKDTDARLSLSDRQTSRPPGGTYHNSEYFDPVKLFSLSLLSYFLIKTSIKISGRGVPFSQVPR